MTDTASPPASNVLETSARAVQLIDMVFPGDTNHHGTLFGGVPIPATTGVTTAGPPGLRTVRLR